MTRPHHVVVLGIVVLAGASACTPEAAPLPATVAPSATPVPATATPTATPFPTSLPQELLVPGNVEGTKFVAEESGVHRFEISGGAYSPCPTHVAFPPAEMAHC
jgi:hypothetical protein